jgi:MoaA/NifB/PqqE/SkfB family radical SAM enzyme
MDSPEHLLTDPEARDRLARHVAGGAPAGLLRSLKIKLLSTCNLRCVMCRYWRIPRRSLPLDVVRRVIDDAAGLGCRKVHLSGGEVTLYPDLVAVIQHAAGRGLRVNLTTNAVLLDRPRARAWLDAGLHAVSVSLDGARAATHDAIRGVAGSFDQAVKGVRNLQRESQRYGGRLRLRINTVMQRGNLDEMPDLIGLAAELGACDVVPMPVDGAGADRPGIDELRRYNAESAPSVLDRRRKYGLPTAPERIYPFGRSDDELAQAARGHYALGYYDRHLCYAPYLHTFVSHHGDVFACCMTAERMPPLGNVHRESLADIFTGSAYERFRAEMRRRRLAMCAHCDQFLPENRALRDGLGEAPAPPARSAFPLPLMNEAS